MLVQFFFAGDSMRILAVLLFAVLTIPFTVAQQNESQDTAKAESAKQVASKKDKKQTTPATTATPDKTAESGKPAEPSKADANEATDKDKEEHYDVAEVPPVSRITRSRRTARLSVTQLRPAGFPSSAATARSKPKCFSSPTRSMDRMWGSVR
jgi:hypothetical protein